MGGGGVGVSGGGGGVGRAPSGDFAMVAGEEYIGDLEAAEVGGLGVLGVFEVVAVGKTLDGGRSGATKDAWEEASDGVDDDESG